jgi:PAS domain-containing protein
MKMLANPVFMRIALSAVVAVAVMFLFYWFLRAMRRNILEGTGQGSRSNTSNSTDFAAAAFQGVLQRYKEQEKELTRLRDADQQRAATQEALQSTILSLLPTGVLLFNKMGLVQQANAAAKTLLGYASPLNFHARDVFKGIQDVEGHRESTGAAAVLEALEERQQGGVEPAQFKVRYATPQGEARSLKITLAPCVDARGQSLGVICLVEQA